MRSRVGTWLLVREHARRYLNERDAQTPDIAEREEGGGGRDGGMEGGVGKQMSS